MFIRPVEDIVERLVARARELGSGCTRVFIATSGGVDSSVTAALLCLAFKPENVVALFRNVKSDPRHLADVKALQNVLGFKLINLDLTEEYIAILSKIKAQFQSQGLAWCDEGEDTAGHGGWQESYASFKSRFTTPVAGFISKAVDGGKGRIFGTGNAEEDGLLRYFDKFGDGAVDNNLIDGLTKMEVRQISLYFSTFFDSADVFKTIALKTPSADLWGTGDAHNDEQELSSWAKNMGFEKARITYGDLESEGTIAWTMEEDYRHGVITGDLKDTDKQGLSSRFGYTEEQLQTILFIREIERATRHKVEPPQGLARSILKREGYVK